MNIRVYPAWGNVRSGNDACVSIMREQILCKGKIETDTDRIGLSERDKWATIAHGERLHSPREKAKSPSREVSTRPVLPLRSLDLGKRGLNLETKYTYATDLVNKKSLSDKCKGTPG